MMFRRTSAGVCAALAVMLCVDAASAEPPIGSRLGDRLERRNRSTSDTSIRGAHALAGCLYNKRASAVRGFLDASSSEEAEKSGRVLGSNIACLNLVTLSETAEGQSFQIPTDIYRGLLAEAVIDDEPRFASLPALPIEKVYDRPWFAVTERDAAVNEMAVCTADTNPVAVRALFRTTPQTAEEGAAIAALGPTLGPCLRVGAKLSANRQSLRAALADAMYQRLFATPPASVVVRAAD